MLSNLFPYVSCKIFDSIDYKLLLLNLIFLHFVIITFKTILILQIKVINTIKNRENYFKLYEFNLI